MTETLISSLSQLPNLNIKPRSLVFPYKGKEADPQTIGKKLNVQAVFNGRVIQRGADLSFFVELIDVASTKVIWSQHYNRKQSEIVSLQSEIARDISSKLKTGMTIPGHLRRSAQLEEFPKARAAALKALELDPTLPGANSILGAVTFFQDRDLNALERGTQRALDLPVRMTPTHIGRMVFGWRGWVALTKRSPRIAGRWNWNRCCWSQTSITDGVFSTRVESLKATRN